MKHWHHTGPRKVFKGILILVYLVLFASQLSYKFYLCANVYTRVFQGKHWLILSQRHPSLDGRSSLLKERRIKGLSMDKRYAASQVFMLPSPTFAIGLFYIDSHKAIHPDESPFASVPSIAHPLRGPPSTDGSSPII